MYPSPFKERFQVQGCSTTKFEKVRVNILCQSKRKRKNGLFLLTVDLRVLLAQLAELGWVLHRIFTPLVAVTPTHTCIGNVTWSFHGIAPWSHYRRLSDLLITEQTFRRIREYFSISSQTKVARTSQPSNLGIFRNIMRKSCVPPHLCFWFPE